MFISRVNGLHGVHGIKGRVRIEARRSVASVVDPPSYDAEQIQVLEGLEPVRKRPGMYIGSTGQRGLHHLVYEVLDNSIDEVQAGHATQVDIDIDLSSSWVTIRDDGRGIPTNVHPRTGKSALETVLTVLHAGGKFGGEDSGYSVSGGLHGVGISVVNALSQELHVTVWRNGKRHYQQYQRGFPTMDLQVEELPAGQEDNHGTEIRFLYDSQIFSKDVKFDPDTLRNRLRELAFLNKAATLRYRATSRKKAAASNGAGIKQEGADWEVLHYDGGLREFVMWMNREKEVLHEPIYIQKKMDGVEVELALQWCGSKEYSETIIGFANSIRTIDGGTHMDGLKASLTRLMNKLGRKQQLLKEGDKPLQGDHIREGLGAVVAVKLKDPEFEGQTKTKLGNPDVRKIVDAIVDQEVGDYMEMHPPVLKNVLAKAIQAANAAEAARAAKELIRRKSLLTKSTLPGKLADCTSRDKISSEIFVVEGDSAGGSAKQARDRVTQAILPLKGKILNVWRADDATVYKNDEIKNLMLALGLKPRGDQEDMKAILDSLRYGKVILLTDADVDGAHIRTLLLTFLYRYRPELFEAGKVYAGVPPLFKVTSSAHKKPHYCYSDADLKGYLAKSGKGASVQRFKGLGEMQPEELWETTMNPATRRLRRLTVEDVSGANHMFSVLMGERVQPRRELITLEGTRLAAHALDI